MPKQLLVVGRLLRLAVFFYIAVGVAALLSRMLFSLDLPLWLGVAALTWPFPTITLLGLWLVRVGTRSLNG